MCERTGLADMSDAKPYKIGEYDTRVEAVTQGFEIKGKDVICSACQVSARAQLAPLNRSSASSA